MRTRNGIVIRSLTVAIFLSTSALTSPPVAPPLSNSCDTDLDVAMSKRCDEQRFLLRKGFNIALFLNGAGLLLALLNKDTYQQLGVQGRSIDDAYLSYSIGCSARSLLTQQISIAQNAPPRSRTSSALA